jgi:hypothetical protein
MIPGIEEEKSLSIKEIYDRVRYFFRQVLKHWLFVVAFSSIGLISVALYAHYSKSYYEADLTFVVKGKDGGATGLDNILSQFGWDGSSSGVNLAKVKSVAFSKSVLKEALFDSAYVNGKMDLLANHLVEIYEVKEAWQSSEGLKDFDRFYAEEKENDSSKLQNLAFKAILSMVRADKNNAGLLAISLDEETDMISFKARTLNEQLSYNLSNSVFRSLNEFYLHDESSSTKNTLNKLRKETDSVGNLLRSKEYQLASIQDRNYGIILRKNQTNQDDIRREIVVLSQIYAEMRKNLELRSFSLKTYTSIFDVLEHPVLPLDKKNKSVPIYGAIGAVLGFIFAVGFLVVRRFFLDQISEK